MIYLTLPELLHVAERAVGGEIDVRDYGLLESTIGRPRASAFGADAYPTLDDKSADLLHSLERTTHLSVTPPRPEGRGGVTRVYPSRR